MRASVVVVLVIAIAAAVFAARREPVAGTAPAATVPASPTRSALDDDSLSRAIATRADEVPVTGRGTVVKLLADDREGSPHQRIIVAVAGGGTVLIAHNIALASRIDPIAVGDQLEFAGDYAWNDKGGVVHWTHHDPQGRHRTGWLRRLDRQ